MVHAIQVVHIIMYMHAYPKKEYQLIPLYAHVFSLMVIFIVVFSVTTTAVILKLIVNSFLRDRVFLWLLRP